jgi:hypothetical protein
MTMRKRLQVSLEESELREIECVAAQRGMTVAEWVRQALREACRGTSIVPIDRKLMAVRVAVAHSYPTGDIEESNAEIGRGY